MNCPEVEERLGAYLDGELEAGERPALEAHLASCLECRRAHEALQAQHGDLVAAFAPLRDAEAGLIHRVIAALPPARARLRWLPLLAAAAAGFLAACLLFRPWDRGPDVSPGPVARAPLARLAVATGPVEVLSGGGAWTPLATGGGIEGGARVRTVGRAKCSFELDDGTEIRLNEGSEAALETGRRIALGRGQLFARIAPGPVGFEVHTEQARIEALGTTIDVSHAAREPETKVKEDRGRLVTVLTVLDGRARLGAHTVSAGQICTMVDGLADPPVAARDLPLLTRWIHEILVLKGPGSPEFERRVNDMLAMLGRTKMEHLVEAEIRSLGDRAALPLARYVQSKDSRDDPGRRRDAARFLADLAGPSSVSDFAGLLADGDPEVRVSAAVGLRRLTGQDLGFNDAFWRGPDAEKGARQWEQWLRQHDSIRRAPQDAKK